MALKDIFNSSTMNGRANVGKATYAFIAAAYLWFKMGKKKPPPPENTNNNHGSHSDKDDCGCGSGGDHKQPESSHDPHHSMANDFSKPNPIDPISDGSEPNINASSLLSVEEKKEMMAKHLEMQEQNVNKYRKDKLMKVEEIEPGHQVVSTIELDVKEAPTTETDDMEDHINLFTFMQ